MVGMSHLAHDAPSAELTAEALEALRALTGRADAVFHDGQLEAIAALVEHRRRALVVQRTGWGKSARVTVEQIKMLADRIDQHTKKERRSGMAASFSAITGSSCA